MNRAEVLPSAKPILFNTDMAKAIQDGRKTVTRRLIMPQPFKKSDLVTENLLPETVEAGTGNVIAFSDGTVTTSNYNIGDILYVREAWGRMDCNECDNVDCTQNNCKQRGFCYRYKSDGSDKGRITDGWHPSIHMPKEAARFFLRVTNVQAERLKNIITGDYRTPLNINREGLSYPCLTCTHHNGDCKGFIDNNTCRLVDAFADLWNSTVKKSDVYKYGWQENPWVWVIEFERMK